MELHQLRYVLAVVDAGSFTAAAERVRVSQSGVSMQVRKLERELGVALLDRSSRRVALTPEDERMLPALRAAVAAVEGVREQASDLRGLVVGALRVGTVTGLTWPALFDAIAEIHVAHPGIDLRLREGVSDELLADVRRGELDVAVAAWTASPPAGLEATTVIDDALVAAVASGHPWASRRRIRPQELSEADLIVLPRGTGARDALDATLARAGLEVAPRWEVATPALLQTLAARGLGVAVASETTVRDATGLVPLPIADDHARSRLGIAWRTDPGAAARALLARLVPRAAADA